jgi:hypothetical protein
MAETIQTIRSAIIHSCGGFENATDDQIRVLWNSLSEKTRQRYLAKIKPEKPEKTGRKL